MAKAPDGPKTVEVDPVPVENPRALWQFAKRVEANLFRRLHVITKHIGHMASNFPNARPDPFQADQLADLLDRYATILEPWAAAEGERIVTEVARRDRAAWMRNSKKMAKILREEIASTPVGLVIQARSREAAELITSLPSEAAQRVRRLTIEARSSGKRPEDLIQEIQASGDVSESRARLIARTEVARTSSLLTQARAEGAGSTHYIWRTVKDRRVRESHRHMEGIVCEWAKPPKLEDGTVTHAGQIYNCRCFPEPIFPD